MSQVSPSSTITPKFTLSLSARIAVLGVIFFAEKLLLNGFVDSERAQAAQGLGEVVRIAQRWGYQYLIAFFAAMVVIAYVHGGEKLSSAAAYAREATIRIGWIFTHVLLVLCLIPLSFLLYRNDLTSAPFSAIVSLWLVLGAAAALSAFLAMAPAALWLQTARALGIGWCYAAIAALLSVGAVRLSQSLWEPTASLTFELVKLILSPLVPLSADSASRVLSTNRFAVEVTEVCSGLEGMGLILAFTVAWLLYFRREYFFPRALLLIPLGLVAIFALNVVRISTLVLIGHAGFPDVAGYGFHTQAGWIAFNAVACGLAFFSRHSTWFNRETSQSSAPVATENPTAAYLVPLLAILAAGVLSHALSSRFETFYPLRLVAGLSALALYRHKLTKLNWRWSWRGPTVGVAIFLIWIICAHFLRAGAAMPSELTTMPPAARSLWIISRVVASVFTVPLAEELAYRGYLMRRLCNADFENVPYPSVGWIALAVSAAAFGLMHGAMWLPGIAAGLTYGRLLIRSSSMGEAVIAHATTNALLTATVLVFDQWELW